MYAQPNSSAWHSAADAFSGIAASAADLLLGFDPTEALRQIAFLAPDGKLIVYDGAAEMVDYIRKNVPRHIIIPVQPVKEQYAKMLNVTLLGAADAAGVFPFDTDALKEAISEMPKFAEENAKAFDLGRSLYNANAR
jgi:indolepyruvate ferredoxin oxidoreductase beta subunit